MERENSIPGGPPSQILRTRETLLELLVEIVHAGELPAGPGLGKVINHDFVARGVRAGNGEVFRVLGIDFGFGFTEASSSVALLVEDLAISSPQVSLRLHAGNAIRHADRETGEGGDGVDVLVGNGGFKLLPERITSVVTAQQ